MNPRLQLPLAIFLGVVVRVPFAREALRTPVDGDTAILGLMARHLGVGTTMWGQPYGSPVEAWLAAPFVAAMGPTAQPLRLTAFLLGLALIPLAYVLGRALDPRAALPAAVLLACPPPYLLLLSALPPPLYPTTLVVCGLLSILALQAGARLERGAGATATLVLWGTLAGLALWTHLMSASVAVAAAVYVSRRVRGRRAVLGAAVVPFLVSSGPLWLRVFTEVRAMRIVSVSGRQATMVEHLLAVLPALHRPIGGLLGTHIPMIADVPDHVVHVPGAIAAAIVLVYGFSLVLAARAARGHSPALLLLATAALTVAAFPFPLRSGPAAIRFLTPAYLPIAVLTAWLPALRYGTRRAMVVVLALACLHLVGGARLLAAWRAADRAKPPFLLSDLEPIRRTLEAHGIRRAYASYGLAYGLTYQSGERIIVSQPWNERFLHYPLPYLDEVRFAKNVAWILTPGIPSDLPTPREFEAALGAIGAVWRLSYAGPAVVYHGFVPPFGSTVEPLAEAGAAGDGDLATFVRPPPTLPATYTLPQPRALDALTLVAGLGAPSLPRSMDLEVSADGVAFDTVAQRRRRGEREDLRWVNGHPQYVLDHELVAIPLGGRRVKAVRITPVASSDPWSLGEVLLHPGQAPAQRAPWDEWLDPGLTWAGRRGALAGSPRRDREDWYYRVLLAARHP